MWCAIDGESGTMQCLKNITPTTTTRCARMIPATRVQPLFDSYPLNSDNATVLCWLVYHSSMAARERKREAVSALRDLGVELGLHVTRRRADMPLHEFEAFHGDVLTACTTQGQRRRANEALALFNTRALPPLPVARSPPPPSRPTESTMSGAMPAMTNDDEGAGESPGFRLRSTPCLFT